MDDQTQAIRSFCELTEKNEEIARMYLERVDYRVEAAIEEYYQESAVKGDEERNEKTMKEMQKRKKEEEEERTKESLVEGNDRRKRQKRENDDEEKSEEVVQETPPDVNWDSLPWPAKKRLFFHLRTDEDCADLANVSRVSPKFHTGVHEFMKNNRPGVRAATFDNQNGIVVGIMLYPSNLPFYGLTALDERRFERSGDSVYPRLDVTLNGSEDPVIDQVSSLLSSHIKYANIYARKDTPYNTRQQFAPADFLLCSHLLSNSTFGILYIDAKRLDDIVAPYILSLVSHTKNIELICEEVQLFDPVAFITQLDSTVSSAFLDGRAATMSSYFGLSHAFWKIFFDEKLANGSFESVEYGDHPRREFTKTPFILPETNPIFPPITWLKWHKKE